MISKQAICTTPDFGISDMLLLCVAQEVEVVLASGACVDNGGKVSREVKGVAAVGQPKDKGEFECDLGFPDDFAGPPGLTINGNLSPRGSSIGERLATRANQTPSVSTPGSNRIPFLPAIW